MAWEKVVSEIAEEVKKRAQAELQRFMDKFGLTAEEIVDWGPCPFEPFIIIEARKTIKIPVSLKDGEKKDLELTVTVIRDPLLLAIEADEVDYLFDEFYRFFAEAICKTFGGEVKIFKIGKEIWLTVVTSEDDWIIVDKIFIPPSPNDDD